MDIDRRRLLPQRLFQLLFRTYTKKYDGAWWPCVATTRWPGKYAIHDILGEVSAVSSIQTVRSELASLARWQCLAFCAWCTERVTPIVHRLGQKDIASAWNCWLDAIWLEISRQTSSTLCIIEEIESRPEASFTDSHYPEYYVMRALGVLWYTQKAIKAVRPNENALNILEEMHSFAADFNFSITADRRIEVLKETSQMNDFECEIEARVLRQLTEASDTSIVVSGELRENARTASQAIYDLLPDYCDAHNWKYN
jgi:hypothetical protein